MASACRSWASGAAVVALLPGVTAAHAERLPLDLSHWRVEAEDPRAQVSRVGGAIDIDTPRGLTLWFERPFDGPVTIRFEARAVAGPGPNDQVSDLNAFWMARERDGTSPLVRPRSGRFEDYDTLLTYYVGIGGNRNGSTRMRRYVGKPGNRPLLPENDRSDPAALLVPGKWTAITLIARDQSAAVLCDGRPLLSMTDAAPYRSGWFGLRTTWSHLQIRRITVTHR